MTEAPFFLLKKSHIVEASNFHFISFIFLMAGTFRLGLLRIQFFFVNPKFIYRELVGRIVLRTTNYYSIHFFLLALASGLDRRVVVPINNGRTILGSAPIGSLFIREYYSKINILGIVLSISAIFPLSLYR